MADTKPAWQPLKKGDKVFLIAPSTPVGPVEIQVAKETYAKMGLEAIASPNVTKPYQNWAGTPEERAQQIIDALHTPGIKAIHSLEGGEGAAAVVAELKRREAKELGILTKAPNRGIPLIGYSDTTFLHQYLGEIGAVSPVQGPSLAYLSINENFILDVGGKKVTKEFITEAEESQVVFWKREKGRIRSGERNIEALRSFLMEGKPQEPTITLTALNPAATNAPKIEGVMVGGCDEPLYTSRFVGHGPDQAIHAAVEKPVLFLEGKSAIQLQTTLALMEKSGDLKRYSAIVLSGYYANTGKDTVTPVASKEIQDELRGALEKSGMPATMPVFMGVPVGHPVGKAEIRPIPLYTKTVIEKGVLTLDRASTQTDLDARPSRSVPSTDTQVPSPSEKTGEIKPKTLVAIQGTAPTGLLQITGTTITTGQLLETSVQKVQQLDTKGKDVVLHFKYDKERRQKTKETVNPVDFVLVPSLDKLKDAKSITISFDGPVTDGVKEYLRDFAKRNLPGVQINIAQTDGKDLPDKFTAPMQVPEKAKAKENAPEAPQSMLELAAQFVMTMPKLSENGLAPVIKDAAKLGQIAPAQPGAAAKTGPEQGR